jgi:tetratricopeptide (TPR) repeat protein/predicted Ser/Thr protein kinase
MSPPGRQGSEGARAGLQGEFLPAQPEGTPITGPGLPPEQAGTPDAVPGPAAPAQAPHPPSTQEALHWQRVKQLLADALEHSGPQRAEYVATACGGDEALRAELLSLLAAADADTAALQQPPARQMLQALQERERHGVDWVGRRLGAYRIVALIARGGMGEVYRAARDDGQYEQDVAIKLMRTGLAVDAAAARFKAERQILASLDHANLAKVLDGGVTEAGTPYFVMEFIAGEPIDAWCNRNRSSTQERLRLFRTVCQVVHYAHQKGVVHRDLKAANILVTHDGVVKLVDFGIAKRLPQDAGPAANPADTPTRTATAWRAMTLAYASPEQVRGDAITPASDIYSLGVVLYRLLTGASPYPAATTTSDYELARAICDTEPAPPSRTRTAPQLQPGERRRLHADLDAVVLTALRKDPAHRYASAEQLADDIFRHLEHLPVQARRGAWGYRASRFVLRHRAAVSVAVLANLALLAGLALAAWQAVEANRQRELAQHHLRDVRQLANVLISDVYDAISALPGSTPARQLVVSNALRYLQRAGAEAGGDPLQQLEIAKGFRNVGDLQGRYGYANLGDYAGALASYDAALRLLEPHAAGSTPRGPDDRALHQELATVYRRKGAVLSMLGRPREAEGVMRQGLVQAAAVAGLDPADQAAQMELASLHGQHSDVLDLLGEQQESVRQLDTAIGLLEAVVARAPDDAQAGISLSTGYTRRGEAHLDRDATPASTQQALGFFRRARQVLLRLVALHPNDTSLARHLAFNHQILGETLLRSGQAAQAAEHHREAVRSFARLADADPADHQFRADLVKAYDQLSQALEAQGDLPAGVAAARQAVAQAERLPAAALANTVIRFSQGRAYYVLAQALAQQAAARGGHAAQRAEACALYRRSLPIIEDIRRQLPQARLSINPDMVQAALQRCGD